ncbi:MAG: hypothetical protein ABIQ60_01250 [Burkholderiaceae bacterium]
MTASPHRSAALQPNGLNAAPFEWPIALGQNLLEMQRLHWIAVASWQSSLTAVQQELWDQWISHWGGGVPIDV